MITYGTVIIWSWAVFLLVWMIASFNVKRDVREEGSWLFQYRYSFLRVIIAVAVAIVAVKWTRQENFLSVGHDTSGLLFVPSQTLGWIGAILVLGGVLFAIWARVYLGRNWSSRPTMKEGHELVTSGPYAFVRHPIYTGLMFACVGAICTGSYGALVLALVVAFTFYQRLDKEEKIMLTLFPNEYPAYQARTKRLIPFVW